MQRKQNGLYNHRLFRTWANIFERCNNTKKHNYMSYGGRCITVCDRWLIVENFIEDMYPTYKEGLSIDRIDNDGNYEPNNCRWTTKNVQARNTQTLRSGNTSGYRGVSFHKRINKWHSKVQVDYKRKHLGYFDTALEAAIAYDKYVTENNLEHTINGVL